MLDDAGLAPALTGAIKAIRKRMTRARTTSSATTKDEAGAQQTAHAPPPTHLSPRVRQQHEVPVSVGGACATRCRATANAKTPSISAPFSRTSEVQSAHVTGGSSQLRDPGQAPGSTPTRQHTPAVVAPPKFVQSYTDLITICLVEIGACKVNRAPSPSLMNVSHHLHARPDHSRGPLSCTTLHPTLKTARLALFLSRK